MKVSSWNIEGRLSRFAEKYERGSPEHIIQGIEQLDSDVLVLPEAFDGERPIEQAIKEGIERMGYRCHVVAYEETNDRQYAATMRPHMMVLCRLETIRSHELSCVGGIRNMLAVDVAEPASGKEVRIFGIHLDDRSEANRLRQIDDLIRYITESELPVIVMGDFNAMHGDSLPAVFLRNSVTRALIDTLPYRRTKDVLRRLSEMAQGQTLCRMTAETGLISADPRGRLTTTPKMRDQEWLPSIRMAQIDHIFVSSHLRVADFRVSRDGGSDHRAISVSIDTIDKNNQFCYNRQYCIR